MSFRFAGAIVGALIAVSAVSLPAAAHSVKLGALELTDLWSRATPPKAPTAAGYLTITNTGSVDDTLVAASTPMSEKGELHIMQVKDGIMTMNRVEGGIAIPAGQTVTLAPGGLHLMFIGLKDTLKEGDKLPVTLTFTRAGSVDTFLHIMPVGSPGPTADGGGMHMDMDHDKTGSAK
jgi:copper(I)-binding protein